MPNVLRPPSQRIGVLAQCTLVSLSSGPAMVGRKLTQQSYVADCSHPSSCLAGQWYGPWAGGRKLAHSNEIYGRKLARPMWLAAILPHTAAGIARPFDGRAELHWHNIAVRLRTVVGSHRRVLRERGSWHLPMWMAPFPRHASSVGPTPAR
ncbi:hypothetical protein NMY22_g15369 [Coprinellus aureogranulatus]|nr:hypothetical protein NMY22_g15369 [Coprinellus aureogranulatus]